MTTPVTRPFSFDHSYELPLRRNLLLLLDLLDLLRFIAGVLLDRLGVAPGHAVLRLPGRSWGGELLDAAAAERIMDAALRAHSSSRALTTAPFYRRRRAFQPRLDDTGTADSFSAEDDAVCAICLAGLDVGEGCQVAELCSCSHAFHALCIDVWVGSGEAATCPLCRAPVSPAAWSWCHARAPC